MLQKEINKFILYRYWILSILLFSLLSGCMNRFEKKLVGFYEVEKYEIIDTLNKKINLPNLALGNDKNFTLTFKSKTINGKWKADDYGDFTLIEFQEGEQKSQGKIVGSEAQPEIEISIPANFYCPFLKTLVFRQKSK